MTHGSAEDLHSALLVAHEEGDQHALIRLYTKAANLAEAEGDTDRAAFFLTHAWIFALEKGHAECASLRQRLQDWGRVNEI